MSAADKVWTVGDVMVEDVVSVTPSTPYRRLVELLWIHGISGLPVVGDAGRVVGIVSESDLLGRGVDRGRTASDLMTIPVVTVGPEATLAEAAATMLSRSLKRLPVADASGRLVGIVSRADLLKVFLRSEETLRWDIAELIQRQLGSAGELKVDISDGVVSLAGAVESEERADTLLATVRSMPGVVAVENRLRWPVTAG